ncbi:hypothetical protein Tco_0505740 [Tanacetum coccineum]
MAYGQKHQLISDKLELVDLKLCKSFVISHFKAWDQAPGLERQPDAAAGAPRAAKDAPAVDECSQADPTPMQVPQPQPPAPRTMPQRIPAEEEVQELRRSIIGLLGDVDRSITDQGIFTTWMVSCITQLMDASGRTYHSK